MLTCDEAGPLIARAVEGDVRAIAPAALEALRAHVAACDACREEMAGQMAVRELLASHEPEPVPAGLEARLRARLDRETAPRSRPAAGAIGPWLDRANWRKWSMVMLPAAAVLVIVATRAIVRDVRRADAHAAALAATATGTATATSATAAAAAAGAAPGAAERDAQVADWIARPDTTRDSLLVWLVTGVRPQPQP